MPFNEANVFVGRARLKAKDIREAMKGRNVDPVIIQTFEGLADNDKTQRDQIEALATMVDSLMDLTNRLVAIISQVKDAVPDLAKLKDVSNVLNTQANAVMKSTARDAIKLKDPDQT